MITGSSVVREARKHIGIKFRHQGRNPATGLDCIGLAVRVLTDLGLPVSDITNYDRDPNPAMMGAAIEPYLLAVDTNEITPGCILWMKFVREPMHIAIVTDIGMIHAYGTIGRVVEHSIDSKWKKRIHRAYRINGVAYE